VHAELSFYVLNIACSFCCLKLSAMIFYILFQNWSTHWNIISYNVLATVIKGNYIISVLPLPSPDQNFKVFNRDVTAYG